MNMLDLKLKRNFNGVYSKSEIYGVFSGYNLPPS